MVFMSSPPISETKCTSGCIFSTEAATATTSWITLAADQRRQEPAPDPVKKIRSRSCSRPHSASMRVRKSSTFSACLVPWR
jgi:hypothetical protein